MFLFAQSSAATPEAQKTAGWTERCRTPLLRRKPNGASIYGSSLPFKSWPELGDDKSLLTTLIYSAAGEDLGRELELVLLLQPADGFGLGWRFDELLVFITCEMEFSQKWNWASLVCGRIIRFKVSELSRLSFRAGLDSTSGVSGG